MERVTLRQISELPGDIIQADDIALFLGVRPQTIRDTARTDPHALGFSVTVIGNKVLIPKKPFIKYWGGTTNAEDV